MAGDDPRAADIAVLSALAAWRQGRGIYRVGPELAEALTGTDLDGTLPVDVLYRLPEVRLHRGHGHRRLRPPRVGRHPRPSRAAAPASRRGRLAKRGRPPRPPDAGRGHRVDTRPGQGQRRWDGLPRRHARRRRGPARGARRACRGRRALPVLGGRRRHRPRPPPAVPRPAMAPGKAPRVWDVGHRLATALRRARLGADDHGGSNAGPRAHLRRAHCLGHAGALSQ